MVEATLSDFQARSLKWAECINAKHVKVALWKKHFYFNILASNGSHKLWICNKILLTLEKNDKMLRELAKSYL